jgi:hypothetical protein
MDRLDGGTHSLSERTLRRRHTSPRSTEMTPRSLHRLSLSLSLSLSLCVCVCATVGEGIE